MPSVSSLGSDLEGFEWARMGEQADEAVVGAIGAEEEAAKADVRGGYIFLRHEVGHTDPVTRFKLGTDRESADWLSVVGTFDGVVFGYSTAQIVTLGNGELLGILHDFLVSPDARGVGVGEAMMNRVIDELKQRSCVGVDAWALPGDRATKNFFEGFGLKARLLTAHRRFDEA